MSTETEWDQYWRRADAAAARKIAPAAPRGIWARIWAVLWGC